MAARLSQVFGGSAEIWLEQQAQYDLHWFDGPAEVNRLKFA
jgi:plasmid maintenance system antidote protein VapI